MLILTWRKVWPNFENNFCAHPLRGEFPNILTPHFSQLCDTFFRNLDTQSSRPWNGSFRYQLRPHLQGQRQPGGGVIHHRTRVPLHLLLQHPAAPWGPPGPRDWDAAASEQLNTTGDRWPPCSPLQTADYSKFDDTTFTTVSGGLNVTASILLTVRRLFWPLWL